ncbi:hypothetical protein IAG44_19110 [Streptomyces roseirectus]|uniref:GntR family transcriptional regulator n=1 Tax=Streptomyces roseirectus TaxID=2768066 RepID=A0A7H0IEW7_9ACTN|nr:hypothetical protein IAG44_19110 [Streptomyces roseirectus]
MGERQSGDGGGREFQQVAGELRYRISEGLYAEGAFLPSQRVLPRSSGSRGTPCSGY